MSPLQLSCFKKIYRQKMLIAHLVALLIIKCESIRFISQEILTRKENKVVQIHAVSTFIFSNMYILGSKSNWKSWCQKIWRYWVFLLWFKQFIWPCPWAGEAGVCSKQGIVAIRIFLADYKRRKKFSEPIWKRWYCLNTKKRCLRYILINYFKV